MGGILPNIVYKKFMLIILCILESNRNKTQKSNLFVMTEESIENSSGKSGSYLVYGIEMVDILVRLFLLLQKSIYPFYFYFFALPIP